MANTYTEPTWGEVQSFTHQEPASSFSEKPISPYEMTGFLVRVLKYHFHNENYIQHPNLKEYVWENSSDTPIVIGPSHLRNKATIDKRPALFVKRGAVQQKKMQSLSNGGPGVQVTMAANGVNLNDSSLKAAFISGQHTVICVAPNAALAEALSDEIFIRFTYYASFIERDLDLHDFSVAQLGQDQEQDNAKTQVENIVPVTFKWTKLYKWKVLEEATR